MDDWAIAWFAWQKHTAGSAYKTLESQDYATREWFRYVRRNKVGMLDAKTTHVVEYLHYLRLELKLANNSIRLMTRILNGFFNFCIGTDRMIRNPINKQFMPKIPKEAVQRKVFTWEQYQQLRNQTIALQPGTQVGRHRWRHYWQPAVTIAYHTGLRLSDVCFLPWSAVNFVDEILTVKTRKLARFRQQLVIPIEPELLFYLTDYYKVRNLEDRTGLILPDLAGLYENGRHGRTYIHQQFNFICRRAGLSGYTFHCFRHAFVTRLINKGVDPITIGSMTGQNIEQITAYAHVSVEAQRNALQKARQGLFAVKTEQLLKVNEI